MSKDFSEVWKLFCGLHNKFGIALLFHEANYNRNEPTKWITFQNQNKLFQQRTAQPHKFGVILSKINWLAILFNGSQQAITKKKQIPYVSLP